MDSAPQENKPKNPRNAGRKPYIHNVKFKTLLLEWINSPENSQMSDELAEMFIKLINNISHRYNFRNYTNLEDMKQTAFLNILKYGKNFNPEKSNPFSYFSTMIFNEFIKMINSENQLKKDKIVFLYNNTDDIQSLKNYYNLDDLD